MAENVYECLFLFDPNHYARDPSAIAQLVEKLIGDADGEILVSRLWAEQRLAYPIEGHRKGAYWLTYFRMPGGNLVGFNRACRIHDTVLRHLVVKVDPRLVDALVAHARGESIDEPEPAEPVAAASGPAEETAAETAPPASEE